MLRVTKLTDYATLLMTVLAERADGIYSTTGLAERAGLELPTVAKILKQLGQAGLVLSTRGASGGYRLSRPPAEISLLDIVEAMEGPLAVTECSGHEGQCGIEHQCGIRANWRRVNDVIVDALRTVSLPYLQTPVLAPSGKRASARIPVQLMRSD
ncbi:MAG: SUF system Fe-S cluster assembly regulator [Aquimonas sp.]|jgi:FeS assembly SUF system regulator|nr:SUF system Fe-S cluster assembly regulator [Aquimonas sp.]